VETWPTGDPRRRHAHAPAVVKQAPPVTCALQTRASLWAVCSGPRFACAGTIPYEEPRLDDVEAVVAVAALHNPARNGILLRHTTNSEVVRS
jgi:hypothetical protein